MTQSELEQLGISELLRQPPSVDKAIALAVYGLYAGEGHHKQWYLERIIVALGDDLARVLDEHMQEMGDWDGGIVP